MKKLAVQTVQVTFLCATAYFRSHSGVSKVAKRVCGIPLNARTYVENTVC